MSSPAAGFNPYLLPDEAQQCPYPLYAQLRHEAGLPQSEECGGFFAVSRYEEVLRVLQDADTFGVAEGVGLQGRAGVILPETDPPMHRRYRRTVNEWFQRDVVDALEAEVRLVARSVLDELGAGPAELVTGFCRPFVAGVSSQVLVRMPDADVGRVQDLLTTLIYDVSAARAAVGELRRLVSADVAARRASPRRGDVLDDVIHDTAADALDDNEVLLLYMSLVVGAFDTTANTLAVALAYLAEHPDQRRFLAADHARLPAAIDEFLRWDSTSQGTARTVHAETEVAGQMLHPGDRLYVLTAAANRDPEQFPNPELCDLGRRPNRHVGFGAGAHRCIGMHLALLMLRTGLSELLDRWPNLCLQPGAVLRYRTTQMRSLVAVPVLLDGGPHDPVTHEADSRRPA